MKDAEILWEEATFPDGLWCLYPSADPGRCHRKDTFTTCKGGSSNNAIAVKVRRGT